MNIDTYTVNGKQYEKLLEEVVFGCEGCAFEADTSCHAPPELMKNASCGREGFVWKEVKFVKPKQQDAIVEELRTMLLQRSQTGIKKYGVTLDRTDLKPSEWCQHALEETLDFAGYILRLKKDLEKIEKLAKGELGEN